MEISSSDSPSVPQMTTGGSESLLLAMKAARDWCRENKGITKPEVVMCYTAHAAFDKAASMLDVKLRKVGEEIL